MSQDNNDYEKKIAQANAARQRQIERQKEKLACPKHQKERLAKQQASQKKTQQRSYERMQERMSDPKYIEEQKQKQYESQYKLAEKQREQLQVKESSPQYIVRKTTIKPSTKKNQLKKDLKQAKPIKSKSAKGRNPTAHEKRLGNKIGDIGCICCLNKNWYTSDMQQQETTKFVSLHHVDGRTKEWAHAKVLPLCAYHHDTPAPSHAPDELTPIHRGNKKEWIKLNGTEDELLKQVYEIIEEEIPWLESAQ